MGGSVGGPAYSAFEGSGEHFLGRLGLSSNDQIRIIHLKCRFKLDLMFSLQCCLSNEMTTSLNAISNNCFKRERKQLLYIFLIIAATACLLPPLPLKASDQNLIYLLCTEEFGMEQETNNFTAYGKDGLETSQLKQPPKPLDVNQLKKHKVVLNPKEARGNWRSDSNPNYYPKHISFSEKIYGGHEILKISRTKRSDGATSFTRITTQMSSETFPVARSARPSHSPVPISKQWFLTIEASGTCRAVPLPKDNLF